MQPKQIDFAWVFGEVVKKKRRRTGLSQIDFGEEKNLSRVYLSKIEAGHGSPSVEYMIRLAKAFDDEPETFFNELCEELRKEGLLR